MRFLLLAIFLFAAATGVSQVPERVCHAAERVVYKRNADGELSLRKAFISNEGKENVRLIAIALNVSLGIYGMHRLYLGTDLKVPIFYTLTAGGACVLWLADLGMLIFAKDIEPFKNNPNVFMWNPPPTPHN